MDTGAGTGTDLRVRSRRRKGETFQICLGLHWHTVDEMVLAYGGLAVRQQRKVEAVGTTHFSSHRPSVKVSAESG